MRPIIVSWLPSADEIPAEDIRDAGRYFQRRAPESVLCWWCKGSGRSSDGSMPCQICGDSKQLGRIEGKLDTIAAAVGKDRATVRGESM